MPSGLYRTPAVLYKFVISNLETEIAAIFTEKKNRELPYDLSTHTSIMGTQVFQSQVSEH